MAENSTSLKRKPILSLGRNSSVEIHDPLALSSEQYRVVISKAPIVRSAIQTLIMQLLSVPFTIKAVDPLERKYYRDLLIHNDFIYLISRVVTDTLEVPFGGALEVVRNKQGLPVQLHHVDGGSLAPTYDPNYPYIQIDPEDPRRRVWFKPGQLARIMWAPLTGLKNYGWTRTPPMDCLDAIHALLRISVYWNSVLSDTPSAGILDLMDFEKDEAEAWLESAEELYNGIHRFKIPVLYDHTEKASFIEFGKSPLELTLQEVMRRYIETVTAAFGISPADLGLYSEDNTKSGTVRLAALSKRQGLGSLLVKIKSAINTMIFPEHVRFDWMYIDPEDEFRTERAKRQRFASLGDAVKSEIITKEEAHAQLMEEGLITDTTIQDLGLEGRTWLQKLILSINPPDDIPDLTPFIADLDHSSWPAQMGAIITRGEGLPLRPLEEIEGLFYDYEADFVRYVAGRIARGDTPSDEEIQRSFSNLLRIHSDEAIGRAKERGALALTGTVTKQWKPKSTCSICEGLTGPFGIDEGFEGRPPCLCDGELEIIHVD